MAKTETPAQGFFDFTKDKDVLIGRDFVVRLGSHEERGPIADIKVMPNNNMVIVMAWQATDRIRNNAKTWCLTQDWPHGYQVNIDKSSIQFDTDGTVQIKVPHGWAGTILPADAPNLQKPGPDKR